MRSLHRMCCWWRLSGHSCPSHCGSLLTPSSQATGQGHQALWVAAATRGVRCGAATVHWCPASTTGELQAAVCCPEPACVAVVAMRISEIDVPKAG